MICSVFDELCNAIQPTVAPAPDKSITWPANANKKVFPLQFCEMHLSQSLEIPPLHMKKIKMHFVECTVASCMFWAPFCQHAPAFWLSYALVDANKYPTRVQAWALPFKSSRKDLQWNYSGCFLSVQRLREVGTVPISAPPARGEVFIENRARASRTRRANSLMSCWVIDFMSLFVKVLQKLLGCYICTY